MRTSSVRIDLRYGEVDGSSVFPARSQNFLPISWIREKGSLNLDKRFPENKEKLCTRGKMASYQMEFQGSGMFDTQRPGISTSKSLEGE